MPQAPKVPAELAKMRFELMFVEPHRAAEWLESANGGNRTLSDLQVARISHDLKFGAWLTTHEAICFDENGRLADGQHRLTAIATTGVGAWVWVCFDLPNGNAIAVNEGRARRLKDAMKFRHGETMNSNVESVTRTMRDPLFNNNVSRAEMVQFYLRHENVIVKGQELLAGVKGKIRKAHLSAVITRSLYTQPEFKVRRLCEVLRTFEKGSAAEQAAIDMISEAFDPPKKAVSEMSSTQFRRWWYRRVEYLAECFYSGRRRPGKSLNAIANEELFPIPGEEGYERATNRNKAA